MKIDLQLIGLEKVQQQLNKLKGPETRVAFAKAINDTGFQVRRAMQAEIKAAFDSPTSYIVNSPKVFAATPDNLNAFVKPTMHSENKPSTGGKVGVDAQQILRAQEDGGKRRDKKSEVLLRRAGILPNGYQTAIPETPFPGSDDGRGNLKGSFITQLLSYLQTFGEQGFKANMTLKRKKKLQTDTVKQVGRRYFVSYGRLRGDREAHFAPGIWAASGTHGSNVRPVLMFVKTPNYSPRLDTKRIAQQVNVPEYLSRRLRFRIREAVGQ